MSANAVGRFSQPMTTTWRYRRSRSYCRASARPEVASTATVQASTRPIHMLGTALLTLVVLGHGLVMPAAAYVPATSYEAAQGGAPTRVMRPLAPAVAVPDQATPQDEEIERLMQEDEEFRRAVEEKRRQTKIELSLAFFGATAIFVSIIAVSAWPEKKSSPPPSSPPPSS